MKREKKRRFYMTNTSRTKHTLNNEFVETLIGMIYDRLTSVPAFNHNKQQTHTHRRKDLKIHRNDARTQTNTNKHRSTSTKRRAKPSAIYRPLY